MKWPLRDKTPALPQVGAVGDFAFRRSFYYHPGVDVYCGFGQEIQAIEDGEVVHIENFTGPSANPPSPWWFPADRREQLRKLPHNYGKVLQHHTTCAKRNHE
jgi:hypothetical protein